MKECTFEKEVSKTIKFRYLLSTPNNFVKGKDKLPLLVFLHGAGERGNDLELVKTHAVPKIYADKAPKDFIILCPQCEKDMVWHNRVYDVWAFIDSIAKEYNCDMERISLTGISMGGFGTWHIAQTYPHYFSAISPVCGGGIPWYANVLKDLPIRAFHGLDDTSVSPQDTIQMINAIKSAGGNPSLTLYEGVGHDSWVNAFEKTDLIEWLVEQKRKK